MEDNKRTYNYIFVDLDDTLWDFKSNAKDALHDIFDEKIVGTTSVLFEDFYAVYFKYNLELWRKYGLGEIDKDTLTVERFYRPMKEVGIDNRSLALEINAFFLDKLAEKTKLVEDAILFLDFCVERNLPLTLISNGFTEVQLKKLRNSKLEHYFTHVVLSEQVGSLKPNPEIFEHALMLNKASKDEVLMIGDNFSADIQGAVNIGIDSVFLNPEKSLEETLHKGITEVRGLSEIIELLS